MRLPAFLESEQFCQVRYEEWPEQLGDEPEGAKELYRKLISAKPTDAQTNLAAGFYHPIAITLCTTLKCNLSCEYCNLSVVPGVYREPMSMDTARAAVDFLFSAPGTQDLSITFFGGEPLLNLDLMRETIDYARSRAENAKRKVTFAITTNAMLLNDGVADLFEDANIMPVVSFDGLYEFQRHRLGNSRDRYDALLEKVRWLIRRLNRNVHIRTTVVPGARNLLSENIKFLLSLGAYRYSFTPAHEYVTDKPLGDLAGSWSLDNIDLLRHFQDELTNEWVRLLSAGYVVRVNPLEPAASQILKPGRPLVGCGACRGNYSVRPDGALFSCYTFFDNPKYQIGDVFSGFDEEALFRERRKFFWNSPVCGKCPMRFNCAGGCFNDMARITEENIGQFPFISCISRAECVKRAAYLVSCAPQEFIDLILDKQDEEAEAEAESTGD